MPVYPELLILRHGQTLWNAAGRFQGQMDSSLTKLGRAQAAAQHEILTEVAPDERYDLCCSPLGRTRQTAEIALAGRKTPISFDDRLMEISVGQLSGLTLLDLEMEYPEVIKDRLPFEWNFHCPGGESFSDLKERVQSWLDDLTGPTIVVTHGIVSRMMRGIVLGLDIKGMERLPGGQGMVYFIKDGVQRKLEA